MLSNKVIFSFHNVSERFNLGFNNIKVQKFNNLLNHIKSLKLKNSEICFDDAYEDIFNNLNSKKLGIEKSIFPITNYINKSSSYRIRIFIIHYLRFIFYYSL